MSLKDHEGVLLRAKHILRNPSSALNASVGRNLIADLVASLKQEVEAHGRTRVKREAWEKLRANFERLAQIVDDRNAEIKRLKSEIESLDRRRVAAHQLGVDAGIHEARKAVDNALEELDGDICANGLPSIDETDDEPSGGPW